MRRVGLLVSVFAGLVGFLAPSAAQPVAAPKGQRVFVTGHSFHMPMVDAFDQISKAAKIDGHKLAGRQSLGGSTVAQHWNLTDDKDQARKAIKTGTVDVLTTSPNRGIPDDGLDKFAALLAEHNPAGRVTIQASWYPNDGPATDGKGFKNAQRDDATPAALRKAWEPWVQRMRDQAKAINDKHKREMVVVVPVGDAVIRLRERITKGEVPGFAKQSELFTDDLGHARAPVGVLTAYCHFAVIYGRTPVGLPMPESLKRILGADAEKMNKLLQELAWDAVLAEPSSGVKVEKGK
ncbi:MAG TPA: hypothetical protein VMZ71_17020 [Gemmataceae bacterium]|nr:hypothetical protein [Gemmataceae bacterium]